MMKVAALVAGLIFSTSLQAQTLPTGSSAEGAFAQVMTTNSQCGGALIAERLVLTAAHCLFDRSGQRIPDQELRVRMIAEDGRQVFRSVTRSFIPSGYKDEQTPTGANISNDIAIVMLDRPVPSTEVRPVSRTVTSGSGSDLSLLMHNRGRQDCRVMRASGDTRILTCRVAPGDSGSPLMVSTSSGPAIAGVISTSIMDSPDGAGATAVGLGRAFDEVRSQAVAASRSGAPGTGQPGAGARALRAGDTGRSHLGARFVRP